MEELVVDLQRLATRLQNPEPYILNPNPDPEAVHHEPSTLSL